MTTPPSRDEAAERGGKSERGARTRARILDAVLEILAEQGPRGLTHRAAAERAGVSLGTTTYHFASRSAMLREAFALHLQRVRSRVEEMRPLIERGPLPEDSGAVATAITSFLASALAEDRASFLATYELLLERARDPLLGSELELGLERNRDLYAQLMARAGSPEPELDAELVVATLTGLVLEWLARPNDPAHAERARRVVERLFTALARSATVGSSD